MKTEQLLSVSQLAEMFNVCETTIHRWHRASLLPEAMRINRRVYRWRASDIAEFMNKQNHISEKIK
jgi:predicted DNA-binding transcriptional regulator AlpA